MLKCNPIMRVAPVSAMLLLRCAMATSAQEVGPPKLSTNPYTYHVIFPAKGPH